MKFVDIKNDIAFRKIFGNENKKIILISFKDMDFYFIELPKFTKQLTELTEITDKWIFFIKEAENLNVIPQNIDDEGLKEAYQDANKHSWEKEELEAYDYAAMREQDERGKMELAEKRAEERVKMEMAKKMKNEGYDNSIISRLTGLSQNEIESL